MSTRLHHLHDVEEEGQRHDGQGHPQDGPVSLQLEELQVGAVGAVHLALVVGLQRSLALLPRPAGGENDAHCTFKMAVPVKRLDQ